MAINTEHSKIVLQSFLDQLTVIMKGIFTLPFFSAALFVRSSIAEMSSFSKIDQSLDDIARTNKPGRGHGRSRGYQFRRGNMTHGSRVAHLNAVSHQMSLGGFQAFHGVPQMQATGKLTVSNLGPSVSEADICELFSSVGPLVSSTLHYDCFGNSLGTAEVMFGRATDAMKAIATYNGITLDGLAMRIEYNGLNAGGAMAGGNVLARLGAAGPMNAGPMNAGPMNAGPFASGPFAAGPFAARPINEPIFPKKKNYAQKRRANDEHYGDKSKDISATDLDNEMDAYMAKRKKF